MNLVDQMESKISEKAVLQRDIINNLFDDLKIKLDRQRNKMMDELSSMVGIKLDHLSQQRKQLEANIDSLDNSVSFSDSLVSNGTDDQIIHLFQDVFRHLQLLKDDNLLLQSPVETKHIEVVVNQKDFDLSPVFSAIQFTQVSSIAVRSLFSPSLPPTDYESIKLPQLVFGREGPPPSHLRSPQGVTCLKVGQDSLIVVSDTGNNRIQVFDEEGHFLRSFGSVGTKDGLLNSPQGIASDHNDHVIVCDSANNRVQIFDTFGTHLLSFGSKGSRPGQFINPFCVAVDHYNNFIVSDNRNNRIQIFDSEGQFVRSFGSIGVSLGQFNGPTGVAVDRDNNIIVCDFANNRVQIFDSQGRLLRSFGSRGTANGQFSGPCGVTVDHHNNILVSEWNNHRLQVFDGEGNHIRTFGSKGTSHGQFFVPSALAINLDNRLVVCEHSNHRVQIF